MVPPVGRRTNVISSTGATRGRHILVDMSWEIERIVRHAVGALLLAAAFGPGEAHAAIYEVGPGQPLAAIGDVPWASLAPGDEVRIHWRPTALSREVGDRPRRHGGGADHRARHPRARAASGR